MKSMFCSVLILFGFSLYAQKNGKPKKDFDQISNIKYLLINSDENCVKLNALRFKSIFIKDVRFDTTNIGTWTGFNSYPYVGYVTENRRINFSSGLSKFFDDCLLKSQVKNIADTSCIIFVQQFHANKRDTLGTQDAPNKNFAQLRAEIYCYYLKSDYLYPAFKIDTTIVSVIKTSKRKIDDSFSDELVPLFFNALFLKFQKTDIHKVFLRQPSNIDSVIKIYNEKFNINIFKNQIYQRGVYMNFTEFKNNASSITNFKIKNTGKITNLYDDNNNIINPLTIFGFCDGKQLFKTMNLYSYPLIKTGNSFEFYITFTSTIKFLADLNMETGYPF